MSVIVLMTELLHVSVSGLTSVTDCACISIRSMSKQNRISDQKLATFIKTSATAGNERIHDGADAFSLALGRTTGAGDVWRR